MKKPKVAADESASFKPRDNRIDYFTFHAVCIVFFTFIAVVDRFTVNLWPLWVDSPGPLIPDNFSVSCFSLIAWISSRMLLVSSSYIFLFQCRVFWNWFIEQKDINKWLKIGDIHQTNDRLHYHVGWLFIGVPVMLHCWVIVFAAMFQQNEVKLYHEWMRPDDENGQSIPFYSNNLLSLGINDVYRIISTTLTFCVFIPYSLMNGFKDRHWSFAQYVHVFGSIIYTVDLLRMKSHPHCWFFNIPFILWWIIDRIYGIFFYRRCIANLVGKIHLDDGYMVLFLRIPETFHKMHAIGDIFYFNLLDCGFDRAHPFTVFQNHQKKHKMPYSNKQLVPSWSGHKFTIYPRNDADDEKSEYIVSRQTTKMEPSMSYSVPIPEEVEITNMKYEREHSDMDRFIQRDDFEWNVGIIAQIIPNHPNCYYRKTWTHQIASTPYKELCGLRAFGPYRSEYRLLIKEEHQKIYPLTPLVLIGSGAGCALLVDFFQYVVSNEIALHNLVHFYFTTRSIAMFQWFTDITCSQQVDNLFVNAHITNHDNLIYHQKPSIKNKSSDCGIGRLSLKDILESSWPNTNVYFCGNPNMQKIVGVLCDKLHLEFHAGHCF